MISIKILSERKSFHKIVRHPSHFLATCLSVTIWTVRLLPTRWLLFLKLVTFRGKNVYSDLNFRILTHNPLDCICPLVVFKSWLLNLKSVPSSVVVEGAVCGDSSYLSQSVTGAPFCQNRKYGQF